ncbi:hypothetical protein NQZ68_031873 [Dissostichus eleginoides]|nr:hypothetical protein NQZ68_031873 [Dissostichus eleginoides]
MGGGSRPGCAFDSQAQTLRPLRFARAEPQDGSFQSEVTVVNAERARTVSAQFSDPRGKNMFAAEGRSPDINSGVSGWRKLPGWCGRWQLAGKHICSDTQV